VREKYYSIVENSADNSDKMQAAAAAKDIHV